MRSAFVDLIRAYVNWCRERFADQSWLVDVAFSHQALEHELESLSLSYLPPSGGALLAFDGHQAVGCAAFRKLQDGICEMKRVFVQASHRGQGIGRDLCTAIIAKAKAQPYSLMRLDAGSRFTEAAGLYRSLGFVTCEPYIAYPEELASSVVFMELDLQSRMPSTGA
jgi:ribosomal protein S18 acetylase RimI-like enzyme